MDTFLEVQKCSDDIAYLPFDEFTTSLLENDVEGSTTSSSCASWR